MTEDKHQLRVGHDIADSSEPSAPSPHDDIGADVYGTEAEGTVNFALDDGLGSEGFALTTEQTDETGRADEYDLDEIERGRRRGPEGPVLE